MAVQSGKWRGSPEASRAPRRDVVALVILLTPLLANTVLSKLAVPLGADQISLCAFLLVGVAFFGLSTGRMEISPTHAVLFFSCLAIMMSTQLIGGESFSLPSIILLVFLHSIYLFVLRSPTAADDGIRFFRLVMIGISALAIIQFVAQFAVGATLAFPLDSLRGSAFFQSGFNNLIPLRYGSSTLKSNGVFLLEPSMLSQFSALALVVEMLYFRGRWQTLLFGVALLCSYSGTGFIMLAAAFPFLLDRRRAVWLAVAGCAGAAIVVAATILNPAPLLQAFAAIDLDAFLGRVGEIESQDSSAFMRFVGIGIVIDQYILNDTWFTLFGRGAGSIFSVASATRVAAHDPTWGKILFEYGLVGFIAYFTLMLYCIFGNPRPVALKAAMLAQFLFLGGYASSPYAHAFIATLLVWSTPLPVRTGRRRTAPAAERSGFNARPAHADLIAFPRQPAH